MDLAAPIEEVKGIGPKTAEVLNKAGIFMLRDLFSISLIRVLYLFMPDSILLPTWS